MRLTDDSRLRGLVAAPHTPFTADGSLALDLVDRQVEHLVDTGVSGVFVAGSTGEGLSLTGDERRALLERWVEAARGTPLRVIAHVGALAIGESVALAAHAEATGADAVASLAPSYMRPATVGALINWLAPVAAACARTPFYYYDIPALTGVEFATDEVLETGGARIPNLAGVKLTRHDLSLCLASLRLGDGEFDVLFGHDEELLGGLVMGSRGFVGSSYNFAAPAYRRVIDAFEAGDLETARRTLAWCVELLRTLARHDYLPAAKVTMGFLGVEVGPARSPLDNLDAARTAALRADLESIDFFATVA